MMINYYEILEISDNSTFEEIKASYRKLCKKWHPDRNPSDEATAKMQLIIEAYQILHNEERRARYDKYRQAYLYHTSTEEESKAQHEQDRQKAKKETEDIFSEFLHELKTRGTRAKNEAWEEIKLWGCVIPFVILALLIIGLLAPQCSSKDPLSNVKYKTYTDSIAGYSVSIPEDMSLSRSSGTPTLANSDYSIVCVIFATLSPKSDSIFLSYTPPSSKEIIYHNDTALLYRDTAIEGGIVTYTSQTRKIIEDKTYITILQVSTRPHKAKEVQEISNHIHQSLKTLRTDTIISKQPSKNHWKSCTTNTYSISYPHDWLIDTLSNNNPHIVILVGQRQNSSIIGISILSGETDYKLSDINAEGRSNYLYSGNFKDAKILENKPTKFKSLDCYRVVKTLNKEGVKLKSISYEFKHKNIFYSIEIGHITNKEDEKLGEEIVRTFKLK